MDEIRDDEGNIVWLAVIARCQRSNCPNEAIVGVDGSLAAVQPIANLLPDGWGFEFSGLDEVLHCEAHLGR